MLINAVTPKTQTLQIRNTIGTKNAVSFGLTPEEKKEVTQKKFDYEINKTKNDFQHIREWLDNESNHIEKKLNEIQQWKQIKEKEHLNRAINEEQKIKEELALRIASVFTSLEKNSKNDAEKWNNICQDLKKTK